MRVGVCLGSRACARSSVFSCVCSVRARVRVRAHAHVYLCFGPQVIIPTYLKAPPEEYTPYLATALAPCMPLILPGVTAKTWEGEFKPAAHAVMQWWKDPGVFKQI